jgi:S1-C subfamily serine protease
MAPQFRLAALLVASFAAAASADEFRLIRSLSGPSGKVAGAKFVFDQVRNRFVYPQDKSFIVYFEWEGPAGGHVLTAFWKQPDGRTAAISPDVKIESATKQLNSYWTFILTDGMASGIWTVEIRIDGQPAGSQPFEIVAPEPVVPSPQPAEIKPPSMDDIFRDASRSMVWVHKIDAAGRREDTALGFVTGKNRVATSFQAVDAATKLQLEFSDGRKVETDTLAACSRTGDWALIEADTLAIAALPPGDPKLVTVGERLIAFNVENGARAIGGVDISGRRSVPGFGERIQISSALASEAAGGPLLDLWGRAVGILGGSIVPGARFGQRSMSVSQDFSMVSQR